MAQQQRSARRVPRWIVGPLVSLITIALMLGLGEIYFRYFNLQSDAYNFTLMGRRWLDTCWKPIFPVKNPDFSFAGGQINLRDRTWTDADVQGKTKIMVIGDSFAAGHGICNVEDRFSNVMQQQLGNDKYAVFNVAMNGWGTPEESFYPRLYPYKPDVIVLSYFVRQIRNAITTTGHTFPELPPAPDWLKNTFLKDSYLADYIYWQIIYKRQVADAGSAIWKALLDAFDTPDIWAAHKAEIQQIIDWAKQNNTPIVVVVWPRLDDIPGSAKPVAKVEAVFKENSVPLISASDLFKNDPPSSLIVSGIDSHPNERTHRRIADAIMIELQKILAARKP